MPASFSPVSPDGTVAFATITLTTDADGAADSLGCRRRPRSSSTWTSRAQRDLSIGVQGQVLEFADAGTAGHSEFVGITVAIVILLIAFGSIVAAGLPIITALLGLVGGLAFVTFGANFLDVATFAPTLAAMIGLGVGIDYALFVINRYRQALLVGHEPKKAAIEAVETAGRAVVFAGSAVVIGLLGLLVLGINFFTGLSIGAAVTVIMVMLSAVWFLPALLSLLGTKALALRLPWGKKPGSGEAGRSRLGALRSRPAKGAVAHQRAGPGIRGHPRDPSTELAPRLRRRFGQARRFQRAHRLRPSRRRLRPGIEWPVPCRGRP